MDPIEHTLFGASLAETGLREKTPLASAALIVGANLPDVDAITMFADGDTTLYWRRGLTHGLGGMVVLYDWRFRARAGARPRA